MLLVIQNAEKINNKNYKKIRNDQHQLVHSAISVKARARKTGKKYHKSCLLCILYQSHLKKKHE